MRMSTLLQFRQNFDFCTKVFAHLSIDFYFWKKQPKKGFGPTFPFASFVREKEKKLCNAHK